MTKSQNIELPNNSFLSIKLLLLAVLISFPDLIIAQWVHTQNPMAIGIHLKVVNEETVFYSTENTGKIYRTVDGAETWIAYQTELSESEINDFNFPSDQVGYACGTSGSMPGEITGVFFKTVDGGETWINQTIPDVNRLYYIDFHNEEIGFVAGISKMLKTQDGGLTFTSVPTPQGNPQINKLTSTLDGVVYISTTKSEWTPQQTHHFSIYRSADFGDTWQEVYLNTQVDASNLNHFTIKDIHFPTSEVGYAVGGSGRVLKTIDGGLNWTESFISSGYNLSAVFFTSSDVGYINNEGGLYKTIDGGNTWVDLNVPMSQVLGVQFASENVGYTNTLMYIFKTVNGGEISNISETEIDASIKIFPNPTNEYISVLFPEGRIQNLEIYNLVGQKVISVNDHFEKIDLSAISSGIYILNIETDKGFVTRRLIKD